VASVPIWLPLVSTSDTGDYLNKFTNADTSWFPLVMLVGALIVTPISVVISLSEQTIPLFSFMISLLIRGYNEGVTEGP
jgi:hypothetical protein